MEQQVNLAHRLTAVEERSSSNTKRLNKLEESSEAINKIVIAIEKMVMKQETMNGNINKLTTDVEALKAEPAKRWKFVVEKSIYFIVAAIIGFFLARFGL
mgnify:CR=1 FL=1